jgi:putative ABC transport system ATP-binding protein
LNAPPLVDVKSLTRTYTMGDETVHALDGVDLEIRSGELVAIMGQSGSGKSTLMNMLGCLDSPSSGSYRLAGIPVEELDTEQLAEVRNRHIGFVFQRFHLLPRQTAIDNVTLPLVYRKEDRMSARERRARAAEALELVGLGDRMRHRPNEMSGGQRQRVAIARALVADPSIVLADEPTGNLDSTTSVEILDLLVALREQGKTVILVTHEPEVSERTERIVLLRDGKVVSDESRVPPSPTDVTVVTPAGDAPADASAETPGDVDTAAEDDVETATDVAADDDDAPGSPAEGEVSS